VEQPTSSKTTEEIVSSLLHWVWSCQLQLDRYIDSLRGEFTSHTLLEEIQSRKLFSRTSYDEHALLLAARNLLREAEDSGGPTLDLPPEVLASIKALRNGYEHFSKLRPHTQQQLTRLKAVPRQVQFGDGDIVIGRVFSLTQFRTALSRLESALLAVGSATAASPEQEPQP
jgi:hypothetical protein